MSLATLPAQLPACVDGQRSLMGCSFLRSIGSAVSLRDRSPSQTVTIFVILVGLFVCLLRIVFLKSSNTLIPIC